MKIISRYVLKQHIGPLIFALAALTSLLMLQYVARQLGNLVGKGIPWKVIGQFFVLSLPLTIALTMPMAVLVATLHAFGRMASENEITAFKASGVRVTALMMPVLIGAAFLVVAMVGFNDQVLPRANHKLRMLQQDMSRAKPTLALNEQVLNQVSAGFYMRIGRLDQESNRMNDVTIYDMTQPQARKTIYADSGDLSFTPDKKDLQLILFNGYQQELGGNTARQLRRSYFRSQAVRVKDIGGDFEQTGADNWKGDREKSICEMQSEYVVNARDYERVRLMYIDALRRGAAPGQKTMVVPKPRPATEGLTRLYCNAIALVFRIPTAQQSKDADAAAMARAGWPSPAGGANVPTTTPNGAPVPGTVAASGAAVPPNANSAPGSPANLPAAALTPGMQAQLAAAKAALLAASPPQAAVATPPPQPVAAIAGTASVSATINPAAMSTNRLSDSIRALAAPGSPSKPDSAATPRTAPTSIVGAPVNAAITPAPAAAVTVAPPGNSTSSPTPVPANSSSNTAVGTPPVGATPLPAAGVPAGITPTVAVVPPAVVPIVPAPGAAAVAAAPGVAVPAPVTPAAAKVETSAAPANTAEVAAASAQLGVVRASMDSLAVEIQKKFALSVACIVFVLFGPPIALRFPRGGVGATLGVSLVVFGLYYICLMAGETLADDGKLAPWIAMWAGNVIFTVLGVLLLLRIEKTADASRGGGLGAWLEDRRAKRAMRNVRLGVPSSATV